MSDEQPGSQGSGCFFKVKEVKEVKESKEFNDMNIFELQRNIHEIISNGGVEDIARIVVQSSESQDMIVALQKEQMSAGKDATGEDIAPSYQSEAYAEFKQEMNSKPDFYTPDLKLTGAFYDAMYFDLDMMNPYSSDPKTPSLVKSYSNKGKNPIFGLDGERIGKYREYFHPKFKEEFLAQLAGT